MPLTRGIDGQLPLRICHRARATHDPQVQSSEENRKVEGVRPSRMLGPLTEDSHVKHEVPPGDWVGFGSFFFLYSRNSRREGAPLK